MSVDADTVTVVALTLAVAVGMLAMTCGSVALLMRALRWIDLAPAHEPSSGTDAGPGGGMGGPGAPAPPPSGQGGEPAWWPEFERQLADWVADREATPSRCA
jgi:hypothetical protein